MSELTFSNNLLKMYTNKNSSVFSLAGEMVHNKIRGKYGIVYDDFDCKKEVINSWKSYNLQTIFTNAPRRKTIHMDDKILFHKRMSDSIFTPESYLTTDDINDKTGLFFVKKTGSTGGKGVNIYNYDYLLYKTFSNKIVLRPTELKNIKNSDDKTSKTPQPKEGRFCDQ